MGKEKKNTAKTVEHEIKQMSLNELSAYNNDLFCWLFFSTSTNADFRSLYSMTITWHFFLDS